MVERALTDKQLSLNSNEFIWDIAGHSEAHGYLAAPVVSLLKSRSANTVLDLGCGNGALSNTLAKNGFEVTGMDHSASGIAMASQTYASLTFTQHDVVQPLSGEYLQRYDAVVAIEVIEHLLLPRKLIDNAMRALRPGGTFVLTTPFHGYWKNLLLALTGSFDSHWHPLRDYGHVKFFSKATIMQLLSECGFTRMAFSTAGRFPPLAKSMIVCSQKPA